MKTGLIIPFMIASFFWNSGASCCLAGQQVMGELKLEGQHVERLTLRRKDGQTEQFNEPAGTIKLAVGEYRLQDVRLKGGFTYNIHSASTYNWVTVTEGKPAILKVGAPLKQTVKIERQGPILSLDYYLTGVGGETYGSMRSKRPVFTVFKGDKEVTTGEFEFG
jgi:hypothetical protein